jgi:membrane-bound serine protease (ClpP class)
MQKRRIPNLRTALIALALAVAVMAAPAGDARSGDAVLLPIDGPIGPATSSFFERSLERAQNDGARFVVVTIDTPGGLDSAMRDIVQAILASAIPVIGYVSPGGARAASAGTYILYATHVAAMAPATNLGAATPVQIGGGGGGKPESPFGAREDEPNDDDGKGADEKPAAPLPGSAMERKVINDAVAYIRSLAELRGRNADWAEKAVREGTSISASEARESGVIDLVAEDVPALLAALDGRRIKMKAGEVEIRSDGVTLTELKPDWRTNLLSMLTNPNVAYLLMLIGIYGLLLEGYNPGAVLPGVVGAICLLLALFAFQVLSVNYAGLGLILLGIVLIIAETFVPSFGALGLGGIISFVIGSVMLLDNDIPGFGIAWQIIGAMALAGALLLMAIVAFAVRARMRPVVSGAEALVGSRGEAVESFDNRGSVRVAGEIWQAVSSQPVRKGQPVLIRKMDGLTLEVNPIEE